MLPLRKKRIKVWYSKAQFRVQTLSPTPLIPMGRSGLHLHKGFHMQGLEGVRVFKIDFRVLGFAAAGFSFLDFLLRITHV